MIKNKTLGLEKLKFSVFACVKFFAYFLSVCGLIYYARGIFFKFFFNPNIGISENILITSEVPFPAITFCSPAIMKGNLAKLSDINSISLGVNTLVDPSDKRPMQELSAEQAEFIAAKAQICYSFSEYFIKNLKKVLVANIPETLHKHALNIDENFPFCGSDSKVEKCPYIRSLTDNGLCYTYNSQGFEAIFNEEAISKDFKFNKDEDQDVQQVIKLNQKYFGYFKMLNIRISNIKLPKANKCLNLNWYVFKNKNWSN